MEGSDSAARATGGLTAEQAAERLRADGPNRLPAPAGTPLWRQLLKQFVHFFALLLWAASALAFVAGIEALGVAIAIVVVVNGLFAFVQELRTERAARRLRDLLPRRVTVVRDGRRHEIDALEVVRDDLVVLGAGDQVSADLVVREAHGLRLDTSTLTGESEPVDVEAGAEVFAGSFVVEGEGVAVVTRTGSRTRLAGIARLTRASARPPTPLARELRRVVRRIALVAVSLGLLFLVVSVLVGIPLADAALFAIGVTVALVPEALLPTVTLSLAIGAQRMARRHALVRRLESVETLGSTTFVYTDKTGTLTRNEMSVVEVWTPGGRADLAPSGYDPTVPFDAGPLGDRLRELARAAARSSTGVAVVREGRWVAQGDPLDAALDVLARRLGLDPDAARGDAPDVRRFAFDPRRRRASVVTVGEVLVKGAPDAVLDRCGAAPGAREAVERMAERGLRVLAVARRALGPGEAPATAEEAEQALELLGILGFEDPPRPHAAASVSACRAAGIGVAMITGDHPATARAIAREVGLLGPAGRVVCGRDLPVDEAALARLVTEDGIVLARVTPEDKLRVAQAARRAGHVVAMTGDGVNDAPALQAADIGVAMGRGGTDVAREAADLVLLDDDFSTIVAAVEQGRATYANARGFLTYHLTDNVAEVTPFLVWALSGGQVPLALGVLQILALDIGTDTLSAVALGAEPPAEEALREGPRRGHLFDRRVALRAFALLGPVEALLTMGAFGVTLWGAGWRLGGPAPDAAALLSASGAAFVTVVLAQSANAFACRSAVRTPWALGPLTNRLLVAAVLVELALAAAFLLVPSFAAALGHALPGPEGWIVALAAGPVMLAVDAGWKRAATPTRARTRTTRRGSGTAPSRR